MKSRNLESLRVIFGGEEGREEGEQVLEGTLLRIFWGLLGAQGRVLEATIAPSPRATARISVFVFFSILCFPVP